MSAGAALSIRVDRRLGAFRLDVAFEAEPAGITVLFGPSGAGKSLTLATVAGALKPDAGRISLGEEVLFDAQRRIDLPMQRRGVGWVTQDGGLFPHLSVDANLRYGLRRARGGEGGARGGWRGEHGVRFEDVVETLGIGHLLKRRPAGLSGGERQRVAIGRALLSQPRLLLLDEPLAALDASRRLDILPYLESLRTTFRLPILYVTHAMAEVVRLADRLVLIDGGRVRAQGRLADVLADTAGGSDTLAAIDGRIAAHDPERGLSWVEAGPLRLAGPLQASPVGAPVRLVVRARDVLLARDGPGPLSTRNVVPGCIEAIVERGADAVLAQIRLLGGARIWSAVSRDAVGELSLAAGVEVFVIITSLTAVGSRNLPLDG